MGGFTTRTFITFIMVFMLFVFVLSIAGLPGAVYAGEEAGATVTIPSTEIKEDEEAATAEMSLEQVEESRRLTAGRVYGLVGLWAVIIACIFLVYLQGRDDNKLYQEGYYSGDLE